MMDRIRIMGWAVGLFVMTAGGAFGQEMAGTDGSGQVRLSVADAIEHALAENEQTRIARAAVDLGDRESGELRLPGPNPITLDPALVTDAGSSRYIVEIYSGLVGFNQDYEVIADLAEELPEPEENSDGSVSYTFTIRRNALFHDGRPVTADDVKYSLERSADPQTGSTVASILP